MSNVRATIALARAATAELLELANFLVRKADDRWVQHEHRWVDVSQLGDHELHELCSDCGQSRTLSR